MPSLDQRTFDKFLGEAQQDLGGRPVAAAEAEAELMADIDEGWRHRHVHHAVRADVGPVGLPGDGHLGREAVGPPDDLVRLLADQLQAGVCARRLRHAHVNVVGDNQGNPMIAGILGGERLG